MAILDKLSLKGEKHDSDTENGPVTPAKVAPPTPSKEAPPPVAKIAPNPPAKEQPPTYAANDPANDPSPEELSRAFSSLRLSEQPLAFPDSDQCLAHLKLLYVFHSLKEDVGYTDGLFNLWNGACERAHNRDEAIAKMREKRWALYIARAVERFQTWWIKVLCTIEPAKRLEGKEMVSNNSRFTEFTSRGAVQKWTVGMLPPIDVLMVWHSFMLNPRNYLEDCIRFGLKDLWATGMPWAAVNAAIDTSFNYNVPDEAKASFVGKTGYNWDNVDDTLTKSLNCPRCSQMLEIPWTTCGLNEKQSRQELEDMNGTGYGDRDFSHMCHRCGGGVDHDLLRVAKFKKETENLILKDWPLGGTILSPTTGGPDAPPMYEFNKYPGGFPNRLISMELRSKVLEILNVRPETHLKMDDVKDMVEKAIQKKEVIKRVNSRSTFQSGLMERKEKLAIRKMMSRYWDNSSIFALELGGAVIRQGVFVDKMRGLDWLHSPAAKNTMQRLLTKYRRFMIIMAQYSLHTCVPTLDVDLAWHTHQLSPRPYYDYTVQHCKKFIDHDDKIAEDKLETAFEWTSSTYQKLFEEVYSECTCWYCEAIHSKNISNNPKLFGTSKQEKAWNNFYDSGAAKLCPPSNSAHISAHSAVKVDEDATKAAVLGARRTRRQKELDTAYEKARRRAQAKGRKLPPRDEYYAGAWGYPYLMYGPYMSMGMMGGVYYAGDPCVMPGGAGMTGACAAGTCGGGVAA
ncbi:Glycine-rich domain-containing protein, partial [Lachnellula suecica]